MSVRLISFLFFIVLVFCNKGLLASSLQTNRMVLATDVVNREPENIKESFHSDDPKIVAFAEFKSEVKQTITFCWFHNQKPYSQWKTTVPSSSRYRTYSQITTRPGSWKVQILDQDHNVLKEQSFDVLENSQSESTGASKAVSSPSSSKIVEKIKTQRVPSGIKEALRSLEPQRESK